jgi:hypothetical protein
MSETARDGDVKRYRSGTAVCCRATAKYLNGCCPNEIVCACIDGFYQNPLVGHIWQKCSAALEASAFWTGA